MRRPTCSEALARNNGRCRFSCCVAGRVKDRPRANMTRTIVIARSSAVCSICGDNPASSYWLAKDMRVPGAAADTRAASGAMFWFTSEIEDPT